MVKRKVTSFEPALAGYLLLDVLFIALGRKTQSTIDKLVQQAHQFHLFTRFDADSVRTDAGKSGWLPKSFVMKCNSCLLAFVTSLFWKSAFLPLAAPPGWLEVS